MCTWAEVHREEASPGAPGTSPAKHISAVFQAHCPLRGVITRQLHPETVLTFCSSWQCPHIRPSTPGAVTAPSDQVAVNLLSTCYGQTPPQVLGVWPRAHAAVSLGVGGTGISMHAIHCSFHKGPPCDRSTVIRIFRMKKQASCRNVPEAT